LLLHAGDAAGDLNHRRRGRRRPSSLGDPSVVAMKQFREPAVGFSGQQLFSSVEEIRVAIYPPQGLVHGNPLRSERPRVLGFYLREIDLRKGVTDVEIGVLGKEAEIG